MNCKLKKWCTVAVSMVAFLLLPAVGFAAGVAGGAWTCACIGMPTQWSADSDLYYAECEEYCTRAGYSGVDMDRARLVDQDEHLNNNTSEPTPEESGSSSGSSEGACSSVPALKHFSISESTCGADKVYVKFTPTGDPGFYLHAQVDNNNGNSVLSAWCTGDAGLCKAVGNGQACSSTDYTGANAWCYKGAE